jgi:hypothetical protein
MMVGEIVWSVSTGRRGTVERLAVLGRVWVRWDTDDEFLYLMSESDLRNVGH